MSKKDTSYSDAMNQWASKQSFLRNKRNRLLHPNPEHPAPVRAFGYVLRLAIVVFILWMAGSRIARKYYTSAGFSKAMKEEVKSYLKASEIESASFVFIGKKGVCKRIQATGAEGASYRSLDAMQLAYELPVLKRIRKAWTIDELRIEEMSVELKSGGKSKLASSASPIPLIAAGLMPKPDFKNLLIKRIICNKADITWGLSRATLGGLEGSHLEMFTDTSDWQMEVTGGKFRQNWLRGLEVTKARVKRNGNRIEISKADVILGRAERPGTLEGYLTLERLPKVDLNLKLPQALTRDLMPEGARAADIFDGELDLDLKITGSINTLAGIQTEGSAKITKATFTKVPALEAIDRMLNLSTLRMFSPDVGELSFTTSGGKMNVTSFECRQKDKGIILRGNFEYTPPITRRDVTNSKLDAFGELTLSAARDQIKGTMQIGVRPSLIEGNEVAQKYFTETSGGRVWMEIPLSGSLFEATSALKIEILSALKDQ